MMSVHDSAGRVTLRLGDSESLSSVIDLPEIGISLRLADLHERVEFGPPPVPLPE